MREREHQPRRSTEQSQPQSNLVGLENMHGQKEQSMPKESAK